MSEIRNFKVGDEVEWTSQSQGSWKTKRGIIQSLGGTNARVLVKKSPRKDGRPRSKETVAYWPYVSSLKHIAN